VLFRQLVSGDVLGVRFRSDFSPRSQRNCGERRPKVERGSSEVGIGRKQNGPARSGAILLLTIVS